MTRRTKPLVVAALAVVTAMVLLLGAQAPAFVYDGGRPTLTTARAVAPSASLGQGLRAQPDGEPVLRYAYDTPPQLARASARPGEYRSAPRALPRSSLPSPSEAADLVRGANPVGSALKSDVYHRSATWAVDDIASNGSVYRFVGNDGVQRTLIQAPGELNGIAGRFEWIVDGAGNLTHQMFVKGGSINGVPITP